jgi:hypothetical protein
MSIAKRASVRLGRLPMTTICHHGGEAALSTYVCNGSINGYNWTSS